MVPRSCEGNYILSGGGLKGNQVAPARTGFWYSGFDLSRDIVTVFLNMTVTGSLSYEYCRASHDFSPTLVGQTGP